MQLAATSQRCELTWQRRDTFSWNRSKRACQGVGTSISGHFTINRRSYATYDLVLQTRFCAFKLLSHAPCLGGTSHRTDTSPSNVDQPHRFKANQIQDHRAQHFASIILANSSIQ